MHVLFITTFLTGGYCEDEGDLEKICSLMTSSPLYSLFRVDSQPIDCPFQPFVNNELNCSMFLSAV